MTSFSIPSFPKFRFPRIDTSASLEELVELCNELLDRYSVFVDDCDASVRKELVGGLHKGRVWACFQVRHAYDFARRSEICWYYEQLEEARQAAIESPMVQYMHHSVVDGLAVKAEPGIPEAARQELLTALWAVLNLERDTDRAEQERTHQTRKGPSAEQRRKLAERSERDRAWTLATRGGAPKAKR